jgi:TRAP-type C4-dicarboxylate transport system substrate-binding protein
MPRRVERRVFLGSALAAPFIRSARAAPVTMRVSVDTAPRHGRTLAIADFLRKLEAASQGEIAPRLFAGGRLYADGDVIRALVLGQLDMAAPGTWHVAAYVPEADFAQLPIFYGQPMDVTRCAIDGIPGEMVNAQIRRKLRVTIPGRWIDLGFATWYSSRKPLKTLQDLQRLKIRNAGGFAQSWRARFFGAMPVCMNWTDVPLALSQGAIDALQSTHESCASARLWDSGLRHALVDHQSVATYIPMISDAFWSSLTPALKTLVIDLWAANIGDYRTSLATAQDRAERDLKARGVEVAYVASDEIVVQHQRMIAEQNKAMKEMKMSPTILACVTDALAAIN